MALSEEIKSYEVNYFGGGATTDVHPYRAAIKLRRADKTLIGIAYFHRAVSTMPDRDSKNNLGYYECHYHALDYPNVIDLLRNEKPIYFEMMESRIPMGNIATGAEPVGEGETMFQ